jgi:hypothetical protein
MKRITQTLQYDDDQRYELSANLSDWHKLHPFKSGVDFEFEFLWAEMEDQDALAFILKHPQWAYRFKDVS